MILLLIAVLLVIPQLASATTYWVSPNGAAVNCTDIDGTTDPGAYMTPAAIDTANCAVAGDTVMWKAGTYTGARVQFTSVLPAGTSADVVSTHLCENDQGCVIAFSSVSNGTGVINTTNAQYYRIGRKGSSFIADCVNGGNGCGGMYLQLTGAIIARDIVIEDVHIRNHHANGFSMSEQQPTNYHDGVKLLYMSNEPAATPFYTTNGQTHSIYITGHNVEVAYSALVTNAETSPSVNYCLHGWHNVQRARVHNNFCTVHQNSRGVTMGDSETYPADADNWVYNNVFYCPTLNCGLAISIAGDRNNGAEVYNNTVYGFSQFLNVGARNLNSFFVNNVCAGGNCTITTNGTNVSCLGTCTSMNPTVTTAASHFTDAANGNFSLIAGSSLINAGTDVNLPYNGSAPDRGAYETFAPINATIDANTLDVTIGSNAAGPLQPTSGTTGWGVNCTGSGCGKPIVSSVSVVSGSSTVIRLTLSGISGGACAVGQTWTWSYTSTTGTVEGQAFKGAAPEQTMFTYSSQATTNICTGSTTSYPGGYHLWYTLDDGTAGTTPTTAQDQSANNLDGTLIGNATWNSMGKSSNSVTLTPDNVQYVAVPFGNMFNPSSTSLTVAFWVKVASGRETLNKGYFGASLGTNQRLYITTKDSTWKLGIQSSSDSTGTSDLSVEAGTWTHLCLVMDSATDIATLYKNGVAGTAAGVVKSYTSYALASNFELGRIGGVATGGGADFDDLVIYQSVQSCNDLYRVREPAPPPGAGTLAQVAHQFGLIYASSGGAWQTYGPLNATSVEVVRGGAVSLVTQIDCTSADCSATGVKYHYAHNGGTFQLVPDTMTADEVQFLGSGNVAGVFTGAADRLSGALTEVKGQTYLTSDAATFDLPQNGSFTWRGVFRFGSTATGTYCFKSYDQGGAALTGGYTPSSGACLTIVNPMASGIGF